MEYAIKNLQFRANIDFISEASPCFRSKNFPPEPDFVMSISENGEAISLYSDDTWDFSPFSTNTKFRFDDYGEENKKLFKLLLYFVIYSHLFPGQYHSLIAWYNCFQNIFRICSEKNINVKRINQFPLVVEEIAKSYACKSPSLFERSITVLHAILRCSSQIGFTLFSERSIAIYKQFDPKYQSGQTPYIPNRIWSKFIQQLDSVLDDFETHQAELEKLYEYIVRVTLSNRENGVPNNASSPFHNTRYNSEKLTYGGTLEDYLKEKGLLKLFRKYVERSSLKTFKGYTCDQFGALLNNVSVSCYFYVLFYSIMRRNEALSLRTDCLYIEKDDRAGDFYLLIGETTKTDPDSNDRWVVTKRVKRAIRIAKTLTQWKVRHTKESSETPFLFQNLCVWQKRHSTSTVRSLATFEKVISRARYFFKAERFDITKEDYEEALALTPSLAAKEWFKIGNIWKFSFHQFRRTLAVHFAINRVSASSTQFQMKHGTREQQFHYQNNAGRLRLNLIAEQEVINEYYAEMSRNIGSVVTGDLILPHRKSPINQEIVRFVTNNEMNKLSTAQRNGAVGFRKNILGGCLKQGTCEYGGFDSIVNCASSNGDLPCTDLVIDRNREQEFESDKSRYENQLASAPKDSPRYKSLQAEIRGYETVIEIIKKDKGDTNE